MKKSIGLKSDSINYVNLGFFDEEEQKSIIDEAIKCKETGEEKTIVFNFSGHGMLDLKGYASYFEGTMQNAK